MEADKNSIMKSMNFKRNMKIAQDAIYQSLTYCRVKRVIAVVVLQLNVLLSVLFPFFLGIAMYPSKFIVIPVSRKTTETPPIS